MATREDVIKAKLPTKRNGMEEENREQLQHWTNQLLGLKWTRWTITQKQASDFLTPSCGPSQQLCPNSQSVIKSLLRDSSVFESWSLTVWLQLSPCSRVGFATKSHINVPEEKRLKNLSFRGQHAVESKAGVAKSMQLFETTSCLSTVHVCPCQSVCWTILQPQPYANVRDRSWKVRKDVGVWATIVCACPPFSVLCECSVHFVFSRCQCLLCHAGLWLNLKDPVLRTHYSHTWKMKKRKVSRKKSYILAPPKTLACDWHPPCPTPPSLIP